MKTVEQVLVRPVMTEKAVSASLPEAPIKKYVFRVRPDATKVDIRKAVESLYEVKVSAVNVSIVKPRAKIVRMKRKRVARPGFTKAWKKAVVTLQSGEIQLYTNTQQ